MGKNIEGHVKKKEVEEFRGAVIDELAKWSPEDFAEQIYGNIDLDNNTRTILQLYLSDRPDFFKKVQSLEGEYSEQRNLVDF